MSDNKMWALVKEEAAPGLALKRVESVERTYTFISGMNGHSTQLQLDRQQATNM